MTVGQGHWQGQLTAARVECLGSPELAEHDGRPDGDMDQPFFSNAALHLLAGAFCKRVAGGMIGPPVTVQALPGAMAL